MRASPSLSFPDSTIFSSGRAKINKTILTVKMAACANHSMLLSSGISEVSDDTFCPYFSSYYVNIAGIRSNKNSIFHGQSDRF
jgi:hypothetical protein